MTKNEMKTVVALAGMLLASLTVRSEQPQPRYSFRYGDRMVVGSDSLSVDPALRVTVEKASYPALDAAEWVLWYENPSKVKSAVLSEIHDGDFLIPLPPEKEKFAGNNSVPGERCVTAMNGAVDGCRYSDDDALSATEYAPIVRYFNKRFADKQFHAFETVTGRSSEGICPFFEVSQDGQGAIVALGWTGDWRATFTNATEGVRVTAGLRRARFFLEPGEKVRLCRVLVMNYAAGEDASNKFRRLIRSHFSHVASRPGSREGLFAAELWGGLTSDEMVRRVRAQKARGLEFEQYWVDAGWYGKSKRCEDAYTGDWWAYTGDWKMNPLVHPDGMTNVAAAVRAAGAGLMLWFEPERVVPTTEFAKEHADWLISEPVWRTNKILYYGNAAARNYVADLVTDYAQRLGLTCYRQDFNSYLSEFFKANDAPDREGITEVRHVTGMYAVWDSILARNPGLVIDNCSSGGRRLDLETLRRSIFFFRSDYQCGFNATAEVIQAHNSGLSRFIPYSGCTTKQCDLYSLRSSYASSHGVAYWNAVFQDEAKVDWAVARKSADEYLRIRRFFSRDFYDHGSKTADPTGWAIWQYHDPETDEGVVLAFRRSESPFDRVTITLKGTDRGKMEIVLPEPRSSFVRTYGRGDK